MAKSKKLPIAKASRAEVCGPTPSSKADKERERRWKAEDALRTCEDYERIKGDKTLMIDVKTLAKEKMDKLKKVAG